MAVAASRKDRTALNVALYQERVAELAAQQAAGVLDEAQMAKGRDEAARELLADTEGAEAPRQGHLGKALPLLAALLVPLLALGLYLHFGAADKVELTQEFAEAPKSMEEMTARLERWCRPSRIRPRPYFLGRAYMAEQRPPMPRVHSSAPWPWPVASPNCSGNGHRRYFAADKKWSPQLQALTDEALKADPTK